VRPPATNADDHRISDESLSPNRVEFEDTAILGRCDPIIEIDATSLVGESDMVTVPTLEASCFACRSS
jgi:hypothetical protein